MLAKRYEFSELGDERGGFAAVEAGRDLPIKRVYFIYGANDAVRRGLRAREALREVVNFCLVTGALRRS
jgi:hypothetical protein